MAQTLKQLLLDNFDIALTRAHIDRIHTHLIEWEIRPGHADGLNSPLLGIEKIHFLTKDVAALFDIFDVEKEHFEKIAHSAPSVDPTRIVSSDAYNLFTIWLVYLVNKSSHAKMLKDQCALDLLKLLHYKFFTSFVNHSFPHKANEAIMEYTIDNLSAKFEIKAPETNTWKLVIEARCKDVLDKNSIHYHTVNGFAPDEKVLYVITDLQTRLKSRLKGVVAEFHKNKDAGNKIGTHSMVSEIGDEKVINSLVSSFDQMIESICNDVLNVNKFIVREKLELVVRLNTNIRRDMFRSVLLKFSDIAVQQYRKGEQMLTQGTGPHEILVGYRALISNVIQKTYRAAIIAGDTNMTSRLAILEKTRNLYRSSRITDNDVLVIKNSVDKFIDQYSDSTRASTNASLKIGFIVYLILMSFDSL